MMRTVGSPDAVRAALAVEAAAAIEALEARVQEAAAVAVEAVPPCEDPEGESAEAAARAAGARRLVLADQAARIREAEVRERWIAQVISTARSRRADLPPSAPPTRRVEAALRHLPGPDAVVEVAPAVLGLLDEPWCQERARAAGKVRVRVTGVPQVADGFRVRTPDGRVTLDHTWEARLERSEPRWRRALASLFDADRARGTR